MKLVEPGRVPSPKPVEPGRDEGTARVETTRPQKPKPPHHGFDTPSSRSEQAGSSSFGKEHRGSDQAISAIRMAVALRSWGTCPVFDRLDFPHDRLGSCDGGLGWARGRFRAGTRAAGGEPDPGGPQRRQTGDARRRVAHRASNPGGDLALRPHQPRRPGRAGRRPGLPRNPHPGQQRGFRVDRRLHRPATGTHRRRGGGERGGPDRTGPRRRA